MLALLVGLLLLGCGTTGAAQHGTPSEPEGPVVASGSIANRPWRLSVDRRGDGSLCSWLEYGPSPARSAVSFGCSAGGRMEGPESRQQLGELNSISTDPHAPEGLLLAFIAPSSAVSMRVAIVLPNRTVMRKTATVMPVQESVAESAGFDEAFGVATILLMHAPYDPCIIHMVPIGPNGAVLERSPHSGCTRSYFASGSAHTRPAG